MNDEAQTNVPANSNNPRSGLQPSMSVMARSEENEHCHLMDLPMELRAMIYSECLTGYIEYPPPLAAVCRQIRHEFLPTFFRGMTLWQDFQPKQHNNDKATDGDNNLENSQDTVRGPSSEALVFESTALVDRNGKSMAVKEAGTPQNSFAPPEGGLMEYLKDFSIIIWKRTHNFPYERLRVRFVWTTGKLEILFLWADYYEALQSCSVYEQCKAGEQLLRSIIDDWAALNGPIRYHTGLVRLLAEHIQTFMSSLPLDAAFAGWEQYLDREDDFGELQAEDDTGVKVESE